MAGDYIHYLLAYNAWANAELLAFLGEHPELESATAPGAFGDALQTMTHLLESEAYYLNRLAGGPPLSDLPHMPLNQLTDYARTLARQTESLLARLPPPDAPLPRTYGLVAAKAFFGQLVHHGNEHRAQVCSIIGAAGLEAPDLSSWRFGGTV